jgi:uncharacterized protein YceK
MNQKRWITNGAAIALMLTLAVATTGCASLMAREDRTPGVYPGVRMSAEAIGQSVEIDESNPFTVLEWIVRPCLVVDLPLTCAVDTVLLPMDAISTISGRCETNTTERGEIR